MTISLMLLLKHFCLNISRAVDAFITHGNEPGGSLAYYADLSTPKNVVKTGLFVTSTAIGDLFIVRKAPFETASDRLTSVL